MQTTYRGVLLAVSYAYRTVSNDAMCVIAGFPPIDLLAEERAARQEGGSKQEKKQNTLQKWQRRWDTAAKGA